MLKLFKLTNCGRYSESILRVNTGMQEYSQRQAGVTWAIVLCVLIPIVLVVVFLAFRQFRKQKEPSVELRQGNDPVMIKHTKVGSFREPTEEDKLKDTT